jgi:hypothetical protein
LAKLLEEKYDFMERDAAEFAQFLLPMLTLDPSKRSTAAQARDHVRLTLRVREHIMELH